MDELREDVIDHVIPPVLPTELIDRQKTRFHIKPTCHFVVGGPHGDTGLTGRKIIVDTYGGMGRHGGGAFSGKDSSKVDRSGAYAARWAARTVVAAGLAHRCEVALAYAIGVADPVAVQVDTFGTGKLPDEKIAAKLHEVFDFRPRKIMEVLGLRNAIFRPTAAYGHFGRPSYEEAVDGRSVRFFSWEHDDHVADLRNALKV